MSIADDSSVSGNRFVFDKKMNYAEILVNDKIILRTWENGAHSREYEQMGNLLICTKSFPLKTSFEPIVDTLEIVSISSNKLDLIINDYTVFFEPLTIALPEIPPGTPGLDRDYMQDTA